MDDLLGLDWKQPSGDHRATSYATGSASSTNTNSYSFDALTRSLCAASSALQPGNLSQPQRTAISGTAQHSNSSPATASTQDAFSSLLSFASASTSASASASAHISDSRSSSQQGNLALAERQKRAQQQARAQQRDQQAAWAGLDSGWDSLGRPSARPTSSSPLTLSIQPAASKPLKHDVLASSRDPWGFDSFADGGSAEPQAKPANNTRWQPAPASKDPFDFDSFDQPASAPPSQATPTPSFAAFDSDPDPDAAAAAAAAGDDDDILGALGKPIDKQSGSRAALHPMRAHAYSTSQSPASSSFSSRQPSPASGSRPTYPRAVSPPPHVIGQIVEMGFSPQQARKALARTNGGLDVEAALEFLVAATGGDDGQRDADARFAEELQRQEAARYRDDGDAELEAYEIRVAERRGRCRMGPDRNAVGPDEAVATYPSSGGLRASSRNGTPSSQAGSAEWQQQADQLYAQASELGANMLGKASAFWSSAKAQAQKALEEHQKASSAEAERRSSLAGAGSERARARRWGIGTGAAAAKKEWEGKPKWMVDAEIAAEAEAGSSAAPTSEAFKDSDDEGEDVRGDAGSAQSAVTAIVEAPPVPRRKAETPGKLPADNFWDDDDAAASGSAPPTTAPRPAGGLEAPKADAKRPYISPNRRGASRPAVADVATSQTAKVHRQVPDDAATRVSASGRHKAEGNEHFKKGAYGDAEACYTRGVDALQSGSLRLVPLLNNRANARLKNGSASAAIEDCERVLTLIHPSASSSFYRPSGEHPLSAELASEINLRDGYAKALLRKAQAYEALEKWKLANQTWELLLEYEKREGSGASGPSNMRFARDGAARCGKILGRTSAPTASATTSASRNRKPAAATMTDTPGENLVAHQKNQLAQEAEAAERLSHKDSVDDRVAAWKGGKETNLRALIASVDTLAWPALDWKKIGMHALVTDAQVKKAYVKAIAKVHPDKLTPNNTTVEQRMLAAGIFNGLNEAWSASQNK